MTRPRGAPLDHTPAALDAASRPTEEDTDRARAAFRAETATAYRALLDAPTERGTNRPEGV